MRDLWLNIKYRPHSAESETINHHLYSLLFYIAILLFSPPIYAIDREEVKAKYLKSLSIYVTWPLASVQTSNQFFNLCILGENPFKDYLEKIYTPRSKINHKPVSLLYLTHVNEAFACHLLYISQSEQHIIDEILRFTQDKPILTVSGIRGFVERQGLFQFYMKGQKVKIKGNRDVFSNHVLKVNSALSNVIKFY